MYRGYADNISINLLVTLESSDYGLRSEANLFDAGKHFLRGSRDFMDLTLTRLVMASSNALLDAINEDCETFQNEWNLHPGRTAGGKSPQVYGHVHYLINADSEGLLGPASFEDGSTWCLR